jgi:hypothetical protein
MKLQLSRQIFEKKKKKPKYLISSEFVQWDPELFHADGRLDDDEANSRFSWFCERA